MLWGRVMALVLAVQPALPALAQDVTERPLGGTWFVGPEDMTADKPGKDTHLYLRIEGEAAKALWDGLRDKPARDECLGLDVKSTKTGIRCEHDTENGADRYACAFAIDLRKGRITPVGEEC
jgi:hypothetical protein